MFCNKILIIYLFQIKKNYYSYKKYNNIYKLRDFNIKKVYNLFTIANFTTNCQIEDNNKTIIYKKKMLLIF